MTDKSKKVREILEKYEFVRIEKGGITGGSAVKAELLSQLSALDKIDEVCICAAVICEDGTIIRGHRHGDCFVAMKEKLPKKGFDSQGFITSKNRYVNRKEGAELQIKAGIISAWTKKPVKDLLFSEDLY